MREIGHFIGGKNVKGTSGRTADVYQPMTGEVIAKAGEQLAVAVIDVAIAIDHQCAGAPGVEIVDAAQETFGSAVAVEGNIRAVVIFGEGCAGREAQYNGRGERAGNPLGHDRSFP